MPRDAVFIMLIAQFALQKIGLLLNHSNIKSIELIEKGIMVKKLTKKPLLLVIAVFGVLLLLGFGSYGAAKVLGGDNKNNSFSAVFLTNGQVYFGKIAENKSDMIKLEEIYYIKNWNQSEASEESKKISLIKLGEEIHGPTDTMNINREHVLFWEELRDNSKVTEAIKKHKEQ